VAAVLIHAAIGEQLHCIFVDHGLLRQSEGEDCGAALPRPLQHPAGSIATPAICSWASSLASPTPAEQKRKIIGGLFIDVFEEEAKRLGGCRFPGPGHALSRCHRERLPSAAGPQRHHQEPSQLSAGLPARMRLKLVEPLRELFKDEVAGAGAARPRPARQDGQAPSPSRARGSPSASPARSRERGSAVLRKADAIYLEEIERAGLYDAIWAGLRRAAAGEDRGG